MLRKNWHVCVLLTLACSTGCSGDDGPGLPIDASGGLSGSSGSGGERPSTGGNPSNTGGAATGTGGAATGTGGNPSNTGGAATGTGGAATGTGGAMGGTSLGGGSGANSGGKSSGGANSGGKSTGGSNSGGASTGGKGSGGASTGGKASGGASTGGKASGGASTGGKSSGGANSGGASGAATGGTAGGSTCPEVNTQLCGMVAQHNTARANVMPAPSTALPEMTWHTAAATAAQSWADQCMFSHSAAGYGQNIYASSGNNPPSPKAVVDSWVSEVEDYDYANNSCSGGAVCGHYTQVVWRASIGLGCGIKACTTNSPFGGSSNWTIVVCNYSPPGNYNNQKPY